jgi:hypothetical protein
MLNWPGIAAMTSSDAARVDKQETPRWRLKRAKLLLEARGGDANCPIAAVRAAIERQVAQRFPFDRLVQGRANYRVSAWLTSSSRTRAADAPILFDPFQQKLAA